MTKTMTRPEAVAAPLAITKRLPVRNTAAARKTASLPSGRSGKAALCRAALETAVLCAGKTLEEARRLGRGLYACLTAEADRCTREGLFGEDRDEHFAGLDRDYNPEITREIRCIDLGDIETRPDVELPKPLRIFNGF